MDAGADLRSVTLFDHVQDICAALMADPPPAEAPDGSAMRPWLGALDDAGLLTAPFQDTAEDALAITPQSVAQTLRIMAMLGSADLSLARLVEGHLNAAKLVLLYGTPAQRHAAAEAGLLGVWGADGPQPARLAPDGRTLTGGKRFASGVGLVRMAVVPVRDPAEATQLMLVDVREPARGDTHGWRMRGMAGSASGVFSLEGLLVPERATLLGPPGCYMSEPWFAGGTWRYAAAHVGAIERIVTGFRDHLLATGRQDAPLQRQRLADAIMAARTARLWVWDAARRVEANENVEASVALAAYARLQTEAAGIKVLALVERGMGLALFDRSNPLERVTRDLSVYLRQANPDALMMDHTGPMLRSLPFVTEGR